MQLDLVGDELDQIDSIWGANTVGANSPWGETGSYIHAGMRLKIMSCQKLRLVEKGCRYSVWSSLRTGSLRERKKFGERSVNPRAKRVGCGGACRHCF